MKKLLLIFSLIFIQHCFAQQNFLKKSELRDSLDAYNFQTAGVNGSLVLIRSETADTSATLRQVIIDTASAIRADMGGLNTAYVDSIALLKLDKSALKDSIIAARKPFLQVVLDSSIITTADTIPLGYLSESFTIDSLIIISYGSAAPNLTYQIYHSGGTAMFSGSQTKNTKGTSKITTFNDATLTSGKSYLVFPSVTSIPARGKLAFYLVGHK